MAVIDLCSCVIAQVRSLHVLGRGELDTVIARDRLEDASEAATELVFKGIENLDGTCACFICRSEHELIPGHSLRENKQRFAFFSLTDHGIQFPMSEAAPRRCFLRAQLNRFSKFGIRLHDGFLFLFCPLALVRECFPCEVREDAVINIAVDRACGNVGSEHKLLTFDLCEDGFRGVMVIEDHILDVLDESVIVADLEILGSAGGIEIAMLLCKIRAVLLRVRPIRVLVHVIAELQLLIHARKVEAHLLCDHFNRGIGIEKGFDLQAILVRKSSERSFFHHTPLIYVIYCQKRFVFGV